MSPNQQAITQERRRRRQLRVRKKLNGSSERPRLAVFRSLKHIYVQIVNDHEGRTLVSANTNEPEFRKQTPYGGNKAAAERIGTLVAQRAKQAGIDRVCFDRRSYKYHGRIQALAEAARKAGLSF